MIEFILLVVLGYLIGSISSAIIISRVFALPDPRAEGSKNPGATNVLRLSGMHYAAGVVIADILKGTLPVLIGQLFHASPTTLGFTALAAVVGHVFPIFFEFKGGKGVATAIGAMYGLNLFLGVLVSAIWLLLANFTRYASLASIITVCLAPLLAITIMGELDVFPPLFFITLLVLYKHRNNITRLMDGNEPKIKLKQNILEEVMESPQSPQPEEAAPVVVVEEKPVTVEEVAAEKPVKKAKTTKVESTTEEKPARKPRVKKPSQPL